MRYGGIHRFKQKQMRLLLCITVLSGFLLSCAAYTEPEQDESAKTEQLEQETNQSELSKQETPGMNIPGIETPETEAAGAGMQEPEKQNGAVVSQLEQELQEYKQRFLGIQTEEDITKAGFHGVRGQIFPVYLEQFGEVIFLPAIEEQYGWMALFFLTRDGKIVYKTDQLETNFKNKSSLKQTTQGLSAVSFQDVSGDGLWDIILITECKKESGERAGDSYKVGDVLFQGEGGFYRDYRISDKINRFSMNQSIEVIAAFVEKGVSTEFLYTAQTMNELLKKGLHVVSEQCYWRDFEKFGRLMVVPGTCRIANYDIFMIYLINEEGNIVWSFQPMGDYDNLYALKGVNCRDIDGDGLKDIVVLARYSYEGDIENIQIETDYAVYYQRTSGFVEDKEIKEQCPVRDGETMRELVKELRACWGWENEDD